MCERSWKRRRKCWGILESVAILFLLTCAELACPHYAKDTLIMLDTSANTEHQTLPPEPNQPHAGYQHGRQSIDTLV